VSEQHDGGAAFPGQHHDEELKQALLAKGQLSVHDVQDLARARYHAGMTLRDYFATAVLSRIAEYRRMPNDGPDVVCQAAFCYRLADAMLAEREQKRPR
jgi:hypothetical protein